MSGTPYITSEDSALLRSALRGFSGGACLEIGAGNAGNLVDLSKRFGLVVGTDLVRPSMEDWKGAGADFVIADSGTPFRNETFDLVAFNPPYLRGEVEDRAVDAGEGMDVPVQFLAEALRAVKAAGTVVFLVSDVQEPGAMQELCAQRGFGMTLVESRRVFFEELRVFAARRTDQLR